MKWQSVPVSTTIIKRAAINGILAEWGDLPLGELAEKTPFELGRLKKCGPLAVKSITTVISQARAGEDVRHPMHRPIGDAA